jgi:hypothetical protein
MFPPHLITHEEFDINKDNYRWREIITNRFITLDGVSYRLLNTVFLESLQNNTFYRVTSEMKYPNDYPDTYSKKLRPIPNIDPNIIVKIVLTGRLDKSKSFIKTLYSKPRVVPNPTLDDFAQYRDQKVTYYEEAANTLKSETEGVKGIIQQTLCIIYTMLAKQNIVDMNTIVELQAAGELSQKELTIADHINIAILIGANKPPSEDEAFDMIYSYMQKKGYAETIDNLNLLRDFGKDQAYKIMSNHYKTLRLCGYYAQLGFEVDKDCENAEFIDMHSNVSTILKRCEINNNIKLELA